MLSKYYNKYQQFLQPATSKTESDENSDTSLNKSPGFVAAKKHLTEALRKESYVSSPN